jgi:Protein of unknown function (DUF2911)
MKRLVTCALLIGGMLPAFGQIDREKLKVPPDADSPYAETTATVGGKTVWVAYHAPSVKGRTVFGTATSLQPEDTIWRLGAQYVTVLHTDVALDLGGLAVPPGEYALYIALDKGKWQLIVNKNLMAGSRIMWGINRDGSTTNVPATELGRVPMTMGKPPALVETEKITVTATGNKGKLEVAWENVTASVPFTAK